MLAANLHSGELVLFDSTLVERWIRPSFGDVALLLAGLRGFGG